MITPPEPHPDRPEHLKEHSVDTVQRPRVAADRVEMYRRSAAEALAEIDELQSEILAAQARVTTLMRRVRSLENLVGAVHELVGPSIELPIALRPVRIEGLSAVAGDQLPQRRRDRVRTPAVEPLPETSGAAAI